MKLEISTGSVKWTIEATDGITSDQVITVINSASISREKFIEIYYDFLTQEKIAVKAYERTETLHKNIFGAPKYSSYSSFRNAKSDHMNR